jgi:hypothetical protein
MNAAETNSLMELIDRYVTLKIEHAMNAAGLSADRNAVRASRHAADFTRAEGQLKQMLQKLLLGEHG